jgi:hypothetical protein
MNKNELTYFLDSLKNYLIIDNLSNENFGLAGKAGTALTFFELAREDSFFEDYAFRFLQESMAFVNNDFSYRGSIGIGIILDYLIENKFIDADFSELFGEYHDQIVEQVVSGTFLKNNIFDYLLYFLSLSEILPAQKRECLDLLYATVNTLSIKDDFELCKKGHFIEMNYKEIIPFCPQNGYNSNPVFVENANDKINPNLLIDNVSTLFQSIMSGSNVDEPLNKIFHMDLNLNERYFNLAACRLLILSKNLKKVPSNLLFFFY